MSTILDTILARKREEVAARRQQVSQFELNTRAASAPPVRGFADAVASKIAVGLPAVIAEVKKASPSKGVIRAEFDPAANLTFFISTGLSITVTAQKITP